MLMQRQAMIGQAKAWIKNLAFLIVVAACTLIILLVNSSNTNAIELDQTWSGDFDGMVERRFIRVLVTYKRGATYEALMRFEKEINKQLKRKHLKINVVFIPVFRNELVSGLVEGRGDIAAAGLTITPERKKFVDFTDPVAEKIDEIVVAAPNAPKLASIEDLSGKEIYVRKSSSYHESLNRLNVSFEQASKPRIILKEVNAGLIPMIVVDNYLADFWSQIFEDIVCYPDIAVNKGGSIAWMIRKKSPKLRQVLNEFIKGHKKGTVFGNIIIKRYFEKTKWIRNSLTDEDLGRFKAAVAFFKRYGNAYDLDWLLVAACAYQESKIDQSTRSPAGAIGVMQLLPSTAAGDPINIPDIEKMGPNIHAGVKYLRWIHDTYFKNEKMDRLNRGLFTFASYNAGPARIQKLRKEALKMRFNPNVWFNNVEVVAAKRIGRETVQYVSNIYKYYTAYRIIVNKGQLKKEVKEKIEGNSP